MRQNVSRGNQGYLTIRVLPRENKEMGARQS